MIVIKNEIVIFLKYSPITKYKIKNLFCLIFIWISINENILVILNLQIPYGVNVSENCRDLILRLLRRDPDERITFDEFFNHPFVDLEHCASNESLSKAVSILSVY